MRGIPRTFNATVSASGSATIRIQPTGMYPWEVTQVSTEMLSAASGAACYLRQNGALITAMIATSDVADGAPSIILNSGDVLTVEWSGCKPGDVGKATIQYDDGVPA